MQSFGPYQLIDRIGSGGMGEIFLARLVREGGFEKRLVIKRILPHLSRDPGFVAMFNNEARIAAQLDHPNICQIFDYGQVDGTTYIAMEYVQGHDLRSILDKKVTIPCAHAIQIVQGCLKALDYAYRQKRVIHRDVSPQNVMIAYAGTVKLMDFGLAKASHTESVASAGSIKGNFSYMSPEQVCGGSVDCRSDLFNLGAVLYEMLCGEPIYAPTTPFRQLVGQIASAEFLPLSKREHSLPAPLVQVVERALQADPEQRFQSASQMRETLEVICRDRQLEVGSLPLSTFLKHAMGPPGAGIVSESAPTVVGQQPIAIGTEVADQPIAVGTEVAERPISDDVQPAKTPDTNSIDRADESARPQVTETSAQTTKTRNGMWIALLVVLLGAGAVLVWGWSSSSAVGRAGHKLDLRSILAVRSPPAPPAPKTGRLVIQVTPTSAALRIDGKPIDKTRRPITLLAGLHTVEISHSGFVTRSFGITIRAGETLNIVRTLTPVVQKPVQCRVESTPAGANVTLNNRATGKLAPQTFPLTVGVHNLELTLAGHYPSRQKLQVLRSKPCRVVVVLQPRRYRLQIGGRRFKRLTPPKKGQLRWKAKRYTIQVSYRLTSRGLAFGLRTSPYATARIGRLKKETPILELRLPMNSRRTVALLRSDRLPVRFVIAVSEEPAPAPPNKP